MVLNDVQLNLSYIILANYLPPFAFWAMSVECFDIKNTSVILLIPGLEPKRLLRLSSAHKIIMPQPFQFKNR